jgi:hypothetical protein
MIPYQSMHVTHTSRVFVVVLRLCCNQACVSSAVHTRETDVHAPASAIHSLARVGSSSPPVCSRWIPRVFVVLVMMRGLLVRARGIHMLSLATPCTLCRPVLFRLYYGFLSCVLLFTYPRNQPW